MMRDAGISQIGHISPMLPNEKETIMAEEPKLVDELKKMEYEPLLPVEMKLIGWSIGLGVILLVVLMWVSFTFFPGQ